MCGRFAQGISLDGIPDEFFETVLDEENNEINEPTEGVYETEAGGEGDRTEKIQLDLSRASQWTPSCNIAPTNTALMVYMAEPSSDIAQSYIVEPSKFGLVPTWAKPCDPTPVNKGKQNEGEKYSRELGKHESKYFNCRRESLAEHRAVWSSCKKHRCVIPIQGYFEWLKTKNEKIPYFIHSKTAPLIFLAGFYSHNYNYKDNFNVNGEYLSSFTVITAPAEKSDKYDLSWLHSRKTLVIEPGSKEWFSWLDPNRDWDDSLIPEVLNSNTNEAYAGIEGYRVSNDVGNPSNKSESILRKVANVKARSVSDFFKPKKEPVMKNEDTISADQKDARNIKQEHSENVKEPEIKTEDDHQSSKRTNHDRDDSSKRVKTERD
ncbi:hypothetical protein KGF57_001546 [Candida theae]|uniref:DUF159-domain-containing protein n=1 Tax=Candida theae TaxID=1198502 RepID=A0AAD5BH35_9ASCO|nr:uncharacterized protein KGF57_001546 [Candida theae]KAI5962006.1 hypothetical protein KGF57_001546 [Candida theae]